MSKLLSTTREADYVDSITGKAYRSVPFWVSGDIAYAIPGFERPIKGHGKWEPFDHASPDRLRRLFNFGPVSEADIAALVLPGAPPFFIHTIQHVTNRVKLGNGSAYGESASYSFSYGPHRRYSSWILSRLIPQAVSSLPEPYQTWFLKTLTLCDGWA